MVGLARLTILVIACILFITPELCSAQRYQWPTLAEVLRQNAVPDPPLDVDTARTITSFGVVNEPSQFAIAYYRYNDTDALTPPLHVLRYDKGARQWHRRAFNEGDVKAPFTSGLKPGEKPMMIDCLGSAEISTAGGFLLVSTHLSPSAECTMVLGPDLRLHSAFSGWEVAAFGSEVVFERSEVHFASTNPLRLAVLDLATGREHDLFPPVNDRFRKQFQQRLAALRDEAWCRENNASCDPKEMSTSLGKTAVNADANAVAVEVTFSAEGFGPAAQSQLGTEKCLYIFKLAPKVEYREFRESELQRMFGVATPDALVRPDVLKRIFAANNQR
jgi:hypothetical protein